LVRVGEDIHTLYGLECRGQRPGAARSLGAGENQGVGARATGGCRGPCASRVGYSRAAAALEGGAGGLVARFDLVHGGDDVAEGLPGLVDVGLEFLSLRARRNGPEAEKCERRKGPSEGSSHVDSSLREVRVKRPLDRRYAC